MDTGTECHEGAGMQMENLLLSNIVRDINSKFDRDYGHKKYSKYKDLFYKSIGPNLLKLCSQEYELVGPAEVALRCVEKLKESPKYLLKLDSELKKMVEEREIPARIKKVPYNPTIEMDLDFSDVEMYEAHTFERVAKIIEDRLN
jgi:hypothetical protein